MTETTFAVTRDDATGHWHAVRAPTSRDLDTMRLFDGAVLLVAVNERARSARLLRAIRGSPSDFAAWCRRSGYRAIAPAAPPEPAALALATRARPFA